MPTNAVSAETMKVGRKGGGKHWTEAEVAARQEAADKLKRHDAQTLKPPDWLDKKARAVWESKLKQISGLKAANELLDALDTETLALYCHAVTEYERLACKKRKSIDNVKAMQSWMRLIGSYAEKLGFNPGARARLVRKISEPPKDDPMGQFD